MNKTTIFVKATGPIFMAGGETKKNAQERSGPSEKKPGREVLIPELRVAGIKGSMRFIWRAIQCADDVNQLRKDEGQLFGNAGGGEDAKPSALRMRVQNVCFDKGPKEMVPHRSLRDYDGNGKPFSAQALKSGGTFELVLTSFGSEDTHTDFIRLFILTTLLYGFGRRSRKGFGTVSIIRIEGTGNNIGRDGENDTNGDSSIGNEICCTWSGIVDHLNKLSKFGAQYSWRDEMKMTVEVQFQSRQSKPLSADDYPCIEEIRLGKQSFPNTSDIIAQIGMAVHHHTGKVFLGYSKGERRFASSVLLSTIPWGGDHFRGVITQLRCTKTCSLADRECFYQELDGRI